MIRKTRLALRPWRGGTVAIAVATAANSGDTVRGPTATRRPAYPSDRPPPAGPCPPAKHNQGVPHKYFLNNNLFK